MIDARANLPIWLRARKASRLGGISLAIGLVTAFFMDTNLPMPAAFANNPPNVPFVVYAPAGAAMLMAWQMSLHYEPNERLSNRPLNRIRAGLLLTATLVMCGPMLAAWWIDNTPWALVSTRNFALVFWGTAITNTILGLRLGTLVATLLVLFVPSFTRTDARGMSSWWGVTEAPATSLFAIMATVAAVIVGLALVLTGVDRRSLR